MIFREARMFAFCNKFLFFNPQKVGQVQRYVCAGDPTNSERDAAWFCLAYQKSLGREDESDLFCPREPETVYADPIRLLPRGTFGEGGEPDWSRNIFAFLFKSATLFASNVFSHFSLLIDNHIVNWYN